MRTLPKRALMNNCATDLKCACDLSQLCHSPNSGWPCFVKTESSYTLYGSVNMIAECALFRNLITIVSVMQLRASTKNARSSLLRYVVNHFDLLNPA
jgi:hypothetical protein